MGFSSRSLLPLLAAAAVIGCGSGSPTEPPSERCERVAVAAVELPPPAALLRTRRSALAAQVGDGVAVVKAGGLHPDPTNEGYRGDAAFLYLTALDIPGAWLVLHVSAGAVDSTLLYLPESATSPGHPVDARAVAGAEASRCVARLSPDVRRLVEADGRTLLVASGLAWSDTLVTSLREAAHRVEIRWDSVDRMRLVKDSAEVVRLRRAAQITGEAIVAAVAAIRAGSSEGAVAGSILDGFRARGASRASFPSIVASGPNALTLHYNANTRTLVGDELILMDVGAEYGEYAGDVSRTFPVSGRFTDRQRALYELVLGAQLAAIAAVRPGITLGSLEEIARAWLRGHSAGLCGERTCDTFFVHALSHSLGLNVHDFGPGAAALAPGMVLTIEPGIYLPDEGIGIRIEDVVLVTATGSEVLSTTVPKAVEEIEALFDGGAAAVAPERVATASPRARS